MSLTFPPLVTSGLSDDQRRAADGLLAKLGGFSRANERQAAYYEGRQRVRDLGISIPPELRNLDTVVGWPGTVVDVLEERLDHDGWIVPNTSGDLGVSDIIDGNRLRAEWSGLHLDVLIYGIGFGVVSSGGPGDPSPLVTLESPTRMTATWNTRRRTVTEALLVSIDTDGNVDGGTLWHDGLVFELGLAQGRWTVQSRERNPLGAPPVVRIVNRPRLGDTTGRSEITRAVRATTDNAIRTVLGMEISREFFAAPMLWLLGADESSFVDSSGNPKSAWETYIGRMKAIGRDEDGNIPDVKSFAGNSPAPFIESLRGLSQLLAAESGMPTSYLGLLTENPPSADSVRALESRLIKRANRRQTDYGEAEGWLMRLAMWVRDRRDPGVTPRPTWVPAHTPTPAAAADEATKLVGAGILPADSPVTQKRVGLSETDRDQIAGDLRRARSAATVSALAAAADAARTDPEVAALSDRR